MTVAPTTSRMNPSKEASEPRTTASAPPCAESGLLFRSSSSESSAADWLRSQGHDVLETRERGADPGDHVVLDWAAAQDRVLITIDTDFGRIIFAEGARHCGVLRLPDVPAAARIALAEQVLQRHQKELEAAAVYSWVSARGGLVAGSEAKFGIRSDRGRKPDLTVYLPDSPKPPRRGVIRVPPDIAVEVISPTPRDVRRDRVEKMDDYAAFGVRFYWIVDPEIRSLEIFELGRDGRYTRALGATEGMLSDVPGCPGLTVSLSDLWAEIDRLAE